MASADSVGYNPANNNFGAPPLEGSYQFLDPNGHPLPSITNPGMVDPSQANPYAASTLSNLQGLQGNGMQMVNEAFDPNYYNTLKANALSGATTGNDNAYARMGLAGSSANLGADDNSTRQLNMSFYGRQLQDQGNALRNMQGMDQNYLGDLRGIQGQYSDFQHDQMGDYMGLTSSANQLAAAQNQMWGSIIGGGLGAAGTAAGGYFRGGY